VPTIISGVFVPPGRVASAGVVKRCSCVSGEPVPVYDLTVDSAHEFIAWGVLVHNCCERKITTYDENNGPIYWAECQQCGARGPITSWAADAVGLFYGEINPLKQDNGDEK
jgi:hypothetical protein